MKEKVKVAISGSFRKFCAELASDIDEFRSLGAEVLSPRSAEVVETCHDFIFLRGDFNSRPALSQTEEINRVIKSVENKHLRAIVKSDFLWLVAPHGYLGNSTSLEIGFAISCGKPIYSRTSYFERVVSAFIEIPSFSESHEIEEASALTDRLRNYRGFSLINGIKDLLSTN